MSAAGLLEPARDLSGAVVDALDHGVLALEAIHGADGAVEDFLVRLANPAALRAFRAEGQAWEGRGLRELVVPGAFAALHELLLDVLRTGAPRCERKVHRGPTFQRAFDVRVAPVDGGVVLSFADASAEQRNLDELQAQRHLNERLALVARRTHNAVVVASPDGRIEWANDGFTRISGYSIDEARGRRPGDVLQGPDTDPQVRAAMAEGLRAGVGFHQEVVNYRKNGEKYINNVEIRPMHGEDGRLIGWMGIAADVTAVRMAERALRRERDLLQKMMECAPFWVLWRDRDLVIRGANPSCAAAFGVDSPERMEGRAGPELPVPIGRDLLGRLASEVLRGGRVDVELTHAHPALGPRTVALSALPITDGDEVTGVLEIRHDLTEARAEDRRRAEAAKMESIGQLAAGMAHEINTPIQFASANVEFVADAVQRLLDVLRALRPTLDALAAGRGPSEAELDELLLAARDAPLEFFEAELPGSLEQTAEGLHRVASIVRAMKTFSHPSGGRRAATDLEEVLRGAVDVSRGEWRHVAEVSVEIPAALPTIRAVRDELGQVALNLVVNAAQAIADARRDGPGHIRVVAVEAEGGVRVDVSDDGCGMDEETRRRAFEPFFTTKEVGRGTGQGLTIVYDVVRRHGGRVEIASAVGVGTTFSVWLPLGIEGDGAVG